MLFPAAKEMKRDLKSHFRTVAFRGFFGLIVIIGSVAIIGCHGNPESGEDGEREERLDVISSRLVDEQGRTLLLRGPNLTNSNKTPDPSGKFIPDWIDGYVFADIAARGFNSVRFLLVWEAIEPEPGVYDGTYLDRVEEIVRLAEAHGIYMILDMHQDLFSRAYGGDGAPAWTLPDWPIPYVPWDPWFINYIRPVVLLAFDRLWRDRDDVQLRFRECWAAVARRFRDEPAVVGYDLLNEPYPGTWLLTPNRFDREGLGPFCASLIERIREEDPESLIFFEPSALRTNVLAPFGFPSALPTDLGEGLVFAPHFYDPLVTMTHRWNGGSARLENAADDLVAEAERLGAALWVGEWNVWEYSVEGGEAYLEAQLRIFDERAASWSFWEYNLDDGGCPFTPGSPNAWMAEALDRPYPQRTAGTIEALSFDPITGEFLLQAGPEPGVEASSEIYLPGRVYGEAFQVEVSDGAPWSFEAERRILQVGPPQATGAQTILILP